MHFFRHSKDKVKRTHKKNSKKHGDYFCNLSLRWIAILSFLTILALGNLVYQHVTAPKVLGISTTIYRHCSFWDFICPIRNFLEQSLKTGRKPF